MGNLGDVFLKNVYSVYRYDDGVNGTNHSIGFAAIKNITSSNSTGSDNNGGSGSGGGNGSSKSAAGKMGFAAVMLALPMGLGLLL
jgi:hypothetical protein